jgi:hypothetical protein
MKNKDIARQKLAKEIRSLSQQTYYDRKKFESLFFKKLNPILRAARKQDALEGNKHFETQIYLALRKRRTNLRGVLSDQTYNSPDAPCSLVNGICMSSSVGALLPFIVFAALGNVLFPAFFLAVGIAVLAIAIWRIVRGVMYHKKLGLLKKINNIPVGTTEDPSIFGIPSLTGPTHET